MATITQIKEKMKCLPEKDIKIADKLLDKRDFVSLEELINSDVEKISIDYDLIVENSLNTEPSKKEIELAAQYEEIKELQVWVSEQASAFKEDLFGEEDNYVDDETLDYYA